MNKIALVTGVSRLKGIGRAICLALASQGIDIFFTYWTPYDASMPWGSNLQEQKIIQEEILAKGVRCACLEVDLSKPESIPLLLDAVEHYLGIPRILINNATYSTEASLKTCSAEVLDKHYAVNLRGTTLLCLEFARRFTGSSGSIVNLTSGQFQRPMLNEIAYAVTKGAVDALTVTLAAELGERGIRVNAVNPGPTDTGWMTPELETTLLPRFPTKRIGLPQDAAKLIAFLASEDANWITGQIIHSEGGFA